MKHAAPPQAPILFTGTPTSIVEEAEAATESFRKVQKSLLENVRPDAATFTDVVAPLAAAENDLLTHGRRLNFYASVSPDAAVRRASAEANRLVDASAIVLGFTYARVRLDPYISARP
jgi:metallopeptidase MepB